MKPTTIRKRWRLAGAALVTATLATCASLYAASPVFTDVDLGSPASAGSVVTNTDGSLTITGGGTDIWNTSDQCNFFYTTLNESYWSMQIKIDGDIQGGDPTWAKCEVMCRNSTTPAAGDAFVAMMYTKPNSPGADWLIDQFRTAPNGDADWIHPNGQNVTYQPPVYTDLFRNGNVFSFYYSFDGVTWTDAIDIDTSTNAFTGADNGTSFGPSDAFGSTVCAGVAVTCHYSTGDPATASVTISGLSVTFLTDPTVLGAKVEPQPWTNYAASQGVYSFVTTNNGAPPQTFGNIATYQWYRNGKAVAGATGTGWNFQIDAADNGAKIYCVATIPSPYNTSVTNTYSTTNTLTVLPNIVYYTNGLKLEYWSNVGSLAQVQGSSLPAADYVAYQQSFDHPSLGKVNYATRNSGWFIPPATDKYVFFVASEDGSDLYLNVNGADIDGKTIIAQEPNYSGYDSWLTAGDGSATEAAQKRSDQWTPGASGVNPPYAAGIPLTAGQPYYIELNHYQGGGGDDFSVTYQTVEEIASAGWTNVFSNGTPTIIAGTNGNIMLGTWPATFVKFSPAPTDINATVGSGASFTSLAVSDGEFAPSYQWYQGTAPIAGATGANLYLNNIQSSQSGSTYFVVATEEGLASITSSVVTLTVGAGIWEPGLCKEDWWYGKDATAVNDLATLEANLLGPPSLTVAAPAVEARAISDAGPNDDNGRISCLVVPATTGNYTFYCCSDDPCDLFLSTDDTPAHLQYIAQEPNWSNAREWLTQEGSTTAQPQKCSDTFVPTTAPSGTAPANPNGIRLVAGQKYYLELDHLNYGGGDNCEATMEPTGTAPYDGEPSLLTGNLIGWYFPRCSYVAYTLEPVSVTNAPQFQNVTFTASGVTDSQYGLMGHDYPESGLTNFVFFQWFINGTAVAGANTSSFTTPALPWQPNAQIMCQMTAIGLANAAGTPIWSNSTIATLNVSTNSTVPAISYASVFQQNGGDTVVDIRFSKPMDPTSLLSATYTLGNITPANYGTITVFTNGSIISKLSPTSEVLTKDQYASIQIQVIGTPTYPFQVSVAGAKDAWGNALASANASFTITGPAMLTDTDIGNGSGDPAVPGALWMNGANSYTIQCEGSDQWNNADGENFAYTLVTGDFDMIVRVKDTTHTSNYSKSGLQVRESLDADSRNWNIVDDPDSSDGIAGSENDGNGASAIEINCRPATAASSQGWANGYNGEPPQYPNAWLRLKRVGQDIYGFYSNDGVNWLIRGHDNPLTAVNGSSNALPAQVYIGISQSAHDNDATPAPPWTQLTYLDTSDYDSFNASYIEVPAVGQVLAAPSVVSSTPAIAFATFYTNNNLVAGPAQVIDLKFNKPMDPGSLTTATYGLPAGLTVASVNVYTNASMNLSATSEALSNNFSSVLLTVTGTPTLPLAVTVTGAKDYWGNPLAAPNNAASAGLCALLNQDIGTPFGSDPVVPSVMWVDGANSYTIVCEGSDIWGNDDGFNFTYTTATGDFDMVVRVKDTTHTSNWSKAGLMVREDLTAGSRDWNIVCDPVTSDGILAIDNTGDGANTIEANCRPTAGAGSTGWATGLNSIPPPYPNAWVRLKRVGQDLYCYYGEDGIHWFPRAHDNPTAVGAKTALPSTVYIGICETAHNNDPTPLQPYANLAFLETADYDSFNTHYVDVPASPAVVASTPAIQFASFYTNNNLAAGPAQIVDLKFNKPMNPASLLASTYVLPSGLTVASVNVYTNESIGLSPTSESLSNNYSEVLLTITGTPALPLAVKVNGAEDYYGNALAAPNNAATAGLCPLVNQDIGSTPLGTDPALPGVMWVDGTNAYTIVCEGSDIWNNDDGFNFTYTELSGDFDVVVRVKGDTHTSNWAKAGLMVREDLTAGSRNWNIVNDPNSSDGVEAVDGSLGANDIECNARNTTGGGSAGWQVETNGMAPAYPNAWLRLQRTGTQLAGYFGTDGTNWTQHGWDDPTTVGSKTALSNTVYVGICQTAHNNDAVPLPAINDLLYAATVNYDSLNLHYISGVTPPSTNITMTVTHTGKSLTIGWSPAGGTLQSSSALGSSASWAPVANATNPMTIAIPASGDQYYRVLAP
jgi:hypothetical protein